MTRTHTGRRRIGRRAQLTLFSGLSGLLLVITAVLVTQVFMRLDGYMSAQKDNLVQAVSRLEIDQVKLLASMRQYSRDAPESFALVRQHLDALSARTDQIASNPAYPDLLDDTASTSLAQIANIVGMLETRLPASGGTPADTPATLEGLVTDLSAPITDLTRLAVSAHTRAANTERGALETRLLQVTLLSVALLVTLLSLMMLLWQLYRLYRRRALENRATLNRLETILNTSQDAVLVVCPDGRIIDTNRAADAMFFNGSLPASDKRIDHILLRKDPEGVINPVSPAMLQKSCETGPNLCANVIAQTAAGVRIPVELSNDRASRGDKTVVICFIRNIARRMADQAELLAARDTALSGEKAKARFLSMISHEMRTPLNGLLGTLDLLQDTPQTKEQVKLTKIMRSSGQALLAQINDALDITQAQQGALTLTNKVFDLDKLIKKLVREQGLSSNLRGNTLHHAPPPLEPLGRVVGDPNRVRQVLLNLLSNAVKFTDNGQITIEACRCVAEAPDLVEFQITDTGLGIDKADHARIFEDFTRLDMGRARAAEGSGLGLGIVRHLVELMGGEYGLESEPGLGSVFWVRLPLPLATTTTSSRQAQQSPDMPAAAMDILIVEDNPINRVVLEEMLKRDGHSVWQAPNGAEGVAVAQNRCFDLILMDISMPVMDGIEAARRIRMGGGASRRSRTLALSAHLTPTLPDSPGIDGVLVKPLRRIDLQAALSQQTVKGVERPQPLPLDLKRLSEMRASLSDDNLGDLLAALQREGDALISALPDQLPDDTGPLIAQVHQVAGLAATVGAQRLHGALGLAEAALRSDDTAQAHDALKSLPAHWHETLAHLLSLRKTV